MRILLFGEFSSLHKFLLDGLRKIGYLDVSFLSNGDGWKKIPGMTASMPILKGEGIYHRLSYYFDYYSLIQQQRNFDVVQFINAGIFPTPLAQVLIKKLRQHNRCLSLLCAGGDYEQVKAYRRHEFKYYVYDYDKTHLEKYNKRTIGGRIRIFNEKYMADQVDIIIPTIYSYTLGYAKKNKYKIIPFPINLDGLEYQSNLLKGKVVFFHGINRELTKGTPFIREALHQLAENYPNDVEVIINPRMPYADYIQVMKRANVIVDQCCGNGNGMNALISMAQGKVVMAGNDPYERPGIDCDFCPTIHIAPAVDQIYSQLTFILENRNKIEQWGYEGRKYVETYHECKMIAQKYIEAWKSTGKI